MRLLITTDSVGGVWTFTQELALGLLRADCEIALVSVGRKPSPPQLQWAGRTCSQFGERFHFASLDAPLEWEPNNETALTGGADELQRIATEFRAELIHSSQFCFGVLSASLPVVITAHSDVLSWAAACRGEELEDTAWLRRYKSLVSEGLRNASAVAAPTHWMLSALGNNFEMPSEQAVIANGRSLTDLPTPGARKLQAVSAGRLWDEAKNIAILKAVDSPMPILVAGEAAYGEAEASRRLGMVELLGQLAEPDLLRLFRESSIYICTSRYEPFGLALLEAALCGCAVLAYDTPSLREVWGDAALYFPDATALSRLLQQLAADPASLATVQLRCAQRARRYCPETMVAAYLTLYRQLAQMPEISRAA